MTTPTTPTSEPSPPDSIEPRPFAPMLFQNEYVWLIFVSSMDIMLTWKILEKNGTEVNPIARVVIDLWQLPGAIVFKFSLMLFVIIACEFSGRHRPRVGRRLARLAIVISALPVMYSFILLFVHTYKHHLPV